MLIDRTHGYGQIDCVDVRPVRQDDSVRDLGAASGFVVVETDTRDDDMGVRISAARLRRLRSSDRRTKGDQANEQREDDADGPTDPAAPLPAWLPLGLRRGCSLQETRLRAEPPLPVSSRLIRPPKVPTTDDAPPPRSHDYIIVASRAAFSVAARASRWESPDCKLSELAAAALRFSGPTTALTVGVIGTVRDMAQRQLSVSSTAGISNPIAAVFAVLADPHRLATLSPGTTLIGEPEDLPSGGFRARAASRSQGVGYRFAVATEKYDPPNRITFAFSDVERGLLGKLLRLRVSDRVEWVLITEGNDSTQATVTWPRIPATSLWLMAPLARRAARAHLRRLEAASFHRPEDA